MLGYLLIVLVTFGVSFNVVDCATKTAFEGTGVNINCGNNKRILVSNAEYANLLPVESATCYDPDAKEKMVTLCGQKQSCSFTPGSTIFNVTTGTCDDATTTYKFRINYDCFKDLCFDYSTYCDNGGSCYLNTIGAPYCICATGFGGLNCEFGEEPCCPGPNCGNGKCSANSFNQAVCVCTGNWTGDNCDVSPCTNSTCLNNGSCEVTSDGEPFCVCQGDWTGSDCSVSPCSNNPCLNGGTCSVDDSGEARCACRGSYLGYFCSVSPCAINPCWNGGTCNVDGSGMASCNCLGSYTGALCSVNPCNSFSCQNDGTCTVNASGDATCSCAGDWTGNDCSVLSYTITDCTDVKNGSASGVYTITPSGGSSFMVYCDMNSTEGGWTVFQRRQDGSVNFFRGYQQYKNGFGSLTGEYWLGNDKLHSLTSQGQYILRVDLKDFDDNTRYAEYGTFFIGGSDTSYKLRVLDYSGDAGDSLLASSGAGTADNKPFSAKDNDQTSTNDCTAKYKGGWWYDRCHASNLNGVYYERTSPYAEGIVWSTWLGYTTTMKETTMKIRRVIFNS